MKLKIVIIAILLIGVAVRLYKITSPIGDWHSWRQADTSAVTRNFVKYGLDLLHPRFDDFSDTSGVGLFNPNGYRMVEFPVFNLVHYTLYSTFGSLSLETWGRLTSVFSALVSSILIFLIVKRRQSVSAGLWSMLLYLLLPFNIYFTRVILPDPMMVTLYLASINFFEMNNLLLGIIFGALAVMVKPMAVFFLLPIIFIYWKQWKKLFLIFLGIGLPFFLWRIWSYRFPEGMPASKWLLNGNGIRFKGAFFQWMFGERIGHMILGSWGVFPLLEGILASSGFWLMWVFGALLYIVVFATGNIQHDYYQIPIMPVIAIMLAIGISKAQSLAKKFVMVVCVLFMLAFSWYQIRGNYQINHYSIVNAGKAVDRVTPKDAIILAPYNGDSALLYQTNRRGFPFMYFIIKDFIDNYKATYYVSVNYDALTREVMNKYLVVEQNPDYVIVKLEELNRL
ncbi:MAG: hypothetical protein AAB550_03510 [Patescibacteria group bacterium]